MKYIWDEHKNILNIQKHQVCFDIAKTVIQRGLYLVLQDLSSDEERYKAIGLSTGLDLLVVVYTYRGENTIRIISARKANFKEKILWQKEKMIF